MRRSTHLKAMSRSDLDGSAGFAKSAHGRPANHVDEQGLILPKKLVNPCLESREVQDLNREIKWNAKA